MTFFRLGILAAATSLSSCLVTTAPEPADFKLSPEALSQKYRTTRKTGSVRLYANEIQTTRDEWGRETHRASGGSLLVKDSNPPIHALAPSISITPEFSEALGKATVKRKDRLFIGQDDSANIRIDGTEVILKGPVLIRGVASEDDPTKTTEPPKMEAASPSPEKEAPKAIPPPPQPEPAKVRSKTPKPVSQPKATSTPTTKKESPAKLSSPPPAAKTNPPPADKPKAVTPVDRARLLNLMREPTDR